MAKGPETRGGLGVLKKTLAIAGVAATAAWFGAEPIARVIIGEPEAPGAAPEKPTPKVAVREAVHAVIGFDLTRSKMMHNLPGVRDETRRFLSQTRAFADGDTVTVCGFAEGATPAENGSCSDFKLPGDKAALLNHVNGIATQDRRPGMQTHVQNSFREMAGRIKAGEPGVTLGWTDAIEDDHTPGKPTLPPGHAPVVIVVPEAGYVDGANGVKNELGSEGVSVQVTQSGDEFGRLLEKTTGELSAKAQREAQRAADKEYAGLMGEYDKRRAEYDAALADSEGRKARAHARIEGVKHKVRVGAAGTLIGLAGLLAVAGTLDYRERNRPRLKGFVVDKRGAFSQAFPIPKRTEAFNLNAMLGENITLIPTKQGIVCRVGSSPAAILRDGDEIIPKVFYYERDPGL